jgi:signal peptidase I
MRDARLLIREARQLLRKRGHRLKTAVLEELERTVDSLDQARQAGDDETARDRLQKLDRLLDKHLASARKSAAREYSESIGIAVIIALLLRAFVVEAFKIPSGSMIPTLRVGDHIFVNKFTYGLRVPFTHVKFFNQKPQRGEVVVFIYPEDESKDFIKRIVAVGGDTVEVRDGRIWINGDPIEREKLPGPCVYTDWNEEMAIWERHVCDAYLEHNDETTYRVVHDQLSPQPPDFGPYRVPEGEVFVMGDNRFHSSDSRMWTTTSTVPETYIKGRALIVWWSSRNWFDGVRWKRFFDLVHTEDREQLKSPNTDAEDP